MCLVADVRLADTQAAEQVYLTKWPVTVQSIHSQRIKLHKQHQVAWYKLSCPTGEGFWSCLQEYLQSFLASTTFVDIVIDQN